MQQSSHQPSYWDGMATEAELGGGWTCDPVSSQKRVPLALSCIFQTSIQLNFQWVFKKDNEGERQRVGLTAAETVWIPSEKTYFSDKICILLSPCVYLIDRSVGVMMAGGIRREHKSPLYQHQHHILQMIAELTTASSHLFQIPSVYFCLYLCFIILCKT